MNTKHSLVILILLAALLLAGCGAKEAAPLAVPEDAKAGDLTGLQDCEYQAKDTKYAAECGTLVVPENWDKADSRLIALPVVRIPASGSSPAEPVFFLNGGPGSPNIVWAPPAWILKNHDVVLVGYRGVEGTVTLDCPEVNRLVKAHYGKGFLGEQTRAEIAPAIKQCAEKFQKENVDLSGYTIPGVVEDLEAARAAFGYERVNLYSLSYGTRVAQIYAYMRPDRLHRLVLIGVNTPGHFIWNRADFDGILKHISELCAKDATCSSRTKDFAQTMYDINHNMPERWLFFTIDPSTIRVGAHGMFFSNTTMPLVFDAYLAAGEGDPSGLAMMNLIAMLMPFDPVLGDQFNKGGSADLDKYQGVESINLGDSIMGAPLSEAVWPMALAWPVKLIPQDLRELQETDVEMLLVNGVVDFSTPPGAVDEAKSHFHRAQSVLLPEFSHVGDVSSQQPAAFERLITSYYDTGKADASLYTYQPLSFNPSLSLTTIARLLVAAIFILPALIIWGVVMTVSRVRRRRVNKS
jgi:pimeloyl-ACP methyl ester carboxylesterase/predicted small lipoprotein YifL